MAEKYRPHTYIGETPHDFERPYQTNDLESVVVPPEGIEAVAVVQEVIDGIDYQILLDIFREEYGKSGIDPDTLTLVPRSRIKVTYDGTADFEARYSPYLEQIQFNAEAFTRETSTLHPHRVLHAFLHEQLHHISTVVIHNSNAVIDRVTVGIDSEKQGHDFLNEGITEVFSGRVLFRYLQRTGGKQSLESRSNLFYYRNIVATYLLSLFYTILTGVPENITRRAIERAYLRNSDIIPPELKEAAPGIDTEKLGNLLQNLNRVEFDTEGKLTDDDIVELFLAHLTPEQQSVFLKKCQQIISWHL